MTNSDPLISVIMACFNSSTYLRESIQSVLAQDCQYWELIITDDCSTDGTVEILEEFACIDSRVRWFRNEKNFGAAVSRNRSLSVARGTYIAFLDADDVWSPQKLSTQIAFMNASNSCFSFTPYGVMDARSVVLPKVVDASSPHEISYKDLLKKTATVGCSTVIIDRSVVGDFSMPRIRTGQDYATWLQILKKGLCANKCEFVGTYYRITPGSLSRNKLKKASRQWQIYRDIEKLSRCKSLYCFFFYAINALYRK